MMAVGMKVSGKVINSMVMERTISMMAVCMKVSGKMGNRMAREFIIKMELNSMKVSGKMGNIMVMERNIFKSGARYVGEWKDGKKHNGTYYVTDGSRYEGEFKDGKPHVVMERTITKMVLGMKVSLKMGNRMVMERTIT